MESDPSYVHLPYSTFDSDPDHHAVVGQDTEKAMPDDEYYFELVVFKVFIYLIPFTDVNAESL
jgi:hypothetical protein